MLVVSEADKIEKKIEDGKRESAIDAEWGDSVAEWSLNQ
jgi:hypothetical protein